MTYPTLIVVASCMLLAPTAPASSDTDLLGFSPAAAGRERQLEAQFDGLLQKDNLREWMQRLSARPHHLGSPYGKENAEFIAGLFRQWGYATSVEEFQVLFPTPKLRRLEIVAPTPFQATLSEPPIPEDSTSAQQQEQLPVYNAYSIDGNVTGELVYVNYGVPKDYEELELRGIDVKGKIVLARYYGSWRGIKPKVAAEHGAIGCIIYSDPFDDGYYQGDVYPRGGFRPEMGAQRGSVADMPLYPGDPLTPGVGATEAAQRLPREQAATLTKIPVLPISYGDALPLLKALGGPVAPAAWRGALPTPYHLGPGPAKVHLQLEFDWKLVPAYDVIAKLVGRERPDQWIVRGNHHDAWVNGATDPVSGLVSLLEEARALGKLVESGWSPKRTIVFAAWDGEEPGLLGSTEWAEAHAEELKQKVAVYINTDSNSRGFLDMGGSHTLETFINQVARDVNDPEKGISVAARLRAQRILAAPTEVTSSNKADTPDKIRARANLKLDALGSGSDYTPFLQHLGIAALNLGYGGEDEYGQYHSIYDSFDHYTRFMDPTFEYGVALAQTCGRAVLRLANAEVLPFDFNGFVDNVATYVDQVQELADSMRKETDERNRRIDDGTLQASFDPTKTFVVPQPKASVPFLNFAPLRNALARLQDSVEHYQAARAARDAQGPLANDLQEQLDRLLGRSERSLTRTDGLPGRRWFVHQIYAPGFYTGYGVKTLPAVREAIEQRKWDQVGPEVERVAETLDGFTNQIDRAAALLRTAN